MTPTPRQNPDEWGAANRVYGPHTGRPGRRDPSLTPYVIAPCRAIASGEWARVIKVYGAQTGKTDGFLDVIGERLDTQPVPMIFVGPTKELLETQFEPRLMGLLDEAETLAGKVARGKRMRKTLKRIAGVPFRLAHAGSSSALKSDPAAIGIVDEVDELLANVKGQGNPVTLLEARGFTYADFVLAAASTPSVGAVDVERDEESGLEFWKPAPPEDLESAIWRMWQEGTRFHWAWPCPHCGTFFIPRFRNLRWPKGATPAEARKGAYLLCPQPDCGGVMEEADKPEMNRRGVYVAPGQKVDAEGNVTGDPPETSTASFWVSGLASPFVTWGKRAEDFLKAHLSGDPAEIQTAINAGFGELYAPGGGDVPEWKEVAQLRGEYPRATVPPGAAWLTASIDVQKDRLVYLVRAWGPRATSWLVDHGELWGEPGDDEQPAGTVALPVWAEAAELLQASFDGMPIRRLFVDSGFRPGKESSVPVNRVYEFCRQFPRLAYPTKGFASLAKPLIVARPEVTRGGKVAKYGLTLIRLDTDHWKSWVHERIRWPAGQPGAWYLHADTDDDYCRQIVSEARIKKPSGMATWVRRSRENHFLDCEAMAAAAGYMLQAHRIGDEPPAERPAARQPPPSAAPEQGTSADDWFGGTGDWFNR